VDEVAVDSVVIAERGLPRIHRLRTVQPGVAIGLLVIVGLMVVGHFIRLPYNPTTPNVDAILKPPSHSHWFGTDSSGFDIFSRTLTAPERDLPLSLLGTLLSLVIGVPLGLIASGRTRVAELLMRSLDVFQAFPLVIIAVAIVTLTGNHIQNIVYAIALINIPRFMRLIRSEALSLRRSRLIEAAVAMGCSPARLLFRHLLPNVAGVIFVQASLAAAYAVIVIASLNFLGIGVSPPTPTWGSMIQSGAQNISAGQWWVSLFPSAALFVAVLAFNAIANSLQHALEGART
jgi:peptide/nickel transport system permease protein